MPMRGLARPQQRLACMRLLPPQVMHMEVVGRTPDNSGQDSGTHTPDSAEKCWGRQMSVASASYYER